MIHAMQVLYTYDIFTKQAYGGISRYVLELARHLPSGVEPLIFAGLHINAYVHPGEAKGVRMPELRYWAPIRERVSRLAQRAYTAFAPPDLYHRTYYGAPFHRGRQPLVLTVYDMIHERFPDFYQDGGQLSAAKRRDCERADHIIAISESTKRDLVEHFSIAPHKVSVVHLASTELGANPDRRQALAQGKPYLLFVGARGGYKNFEALLTAYAASPRLQQAFDLVCFGGGAATPSEQQRIAFLEVGQHVRFVSGADDDLRAYYDGARLLIYPSLYEGFGLPVLEAMQAGCPVMCSPSSSLPEVAGSAAAYIGSDFAEQLDQLAFDDTTLAALRAAGRTQARRFSWARCAEETTALYRTMLAC
jgi:glycosyltransferase involved in cell wall biosynthesis